MDWNKLWHFQLNSNFFFYADLKESQLRVFRFEHRATLKYLSSISLSWKEKQNHGLKTPKAKAHIPFFFGFSLLFFWFGWSCTRTPFPYSRISIRADNSCMIISIVNVCASSASLNFSYCVNVKTWIFNGISHRIYISIFQIFHLGNLISRALAMQPALFFTGWLLPAAIFFFAPHIFISYKSVNFGICLSVSLLLFYPHSCSIYHHPCWMCAFGASFFGYIENVLLFSLLFFFIHFFVWDYMEI